MYRELTFCYLNANVNDFGLLIDPISYQLSTYQQFVGVVTFGFIIDGYLISQQTVGQLMPCLWIKNSSFVLSS